MVRDRTDRTPISMASVELFRGDSLYEGDVTHKGIYSIPGSRAGDFILQVSAAGYKTYKVPVSLTKGKMQVVDVALICDKCPIVKAFDQYDFSKGGYSILGVKYMEGDRNRLADSLGEFFTDDITVLNEFKQTWIFRKPSPKYACGYHYRVFLCYRGKSVKDFRININCNEIVGDEGYFYFEEDKLRRFYKRMKRFSMDHKKFQTIEEGRTYYKNVLNDSSLILAPEPPWLKYEGSFEFEYKFKPGCKDCYLQDEKYLKILTAEIKKAYPGEAFEVEEWGGSMEDINVRVKCNKSLYDKFKLYPMTFPKWNAYDLGYYTYWRKKPK